LETGGSMIGKDRNMLGSDVNTPQLHVHADFYSNWVFNAAMRRRAQPALWLDCRACDRPTKSAQKQAPA